MMRQDQLADLFVGTDKEGTASNMFIEGRTIYSYGLHHPLAVKTPGCFLINTSPYSITTSHHLHTVAWAIRRGGAGAVYMDLLKVRQVCDPETINIKSLDGKLGIVRGTAHAGLPYKKTKRIKFLSFFTQADYGHIVSYNRSFPPYYLRYVCFNYIDSRGNTIGFEDQSRQRFLDWLVSSGHYEKIIEHLDLSEKRMRRIGLA